jgi:hypothetical protein
MKKGDSVMQTFEFKANYRDGVIAVPEDIQRKISDAGLKVILIVEESKPETQKTCFQAIRVNTKGFIFNREDAHER